VERAIEAVRGQREEMVRSLRALVEEPSYTRDKAGADRAGAALREMMPWDAEVVRSERFGDHLFFHHGRSPGEGGVVLVGHLDTVFPPATFAGFRVEGEVARGPGVLDMKGGLVVMAFALRALAAHGGFDGRGVTVAVVSDEEVGSPESAALLREAARGADCALVFESGRAGDAIITRRKGTGTVTLDATGRAAHAGNAHHLGASAIRSMARWIDRAEALTDVARGVTVNVGLVSGGTSKNTVPERCRAEVDFRYVEPDDGEAVVRAFDALAREVALPGTQLARSGGVSRRPLTRTAESAALCARYAACQRAAGLGDAEAGLVGGGSDASTTADAGVASIDGLGPRGEGFHTLGEYVELATLTQKAEALVRFLAGM
jgi:glutamate carboxypeptidase